MQEINVEQIMKEIRDEIKAKGYKASDLSFNDISLSTENSNILDDINILKNTWNLNYYKNLGSGLKGFIKKCIRKLMKPIVYDLFVQESLYNSACARTINYLNSKIEELEEQVKQQEKK